MLGYVHDSTSIWRLWNAKRQYVIQVWNIHDELAKTAESVESTTSDPFQIAKLDADTPKHVDNKAETTWQANADSPRQTDPSSFVADEL